MFIIPLKYIQVGDLCKKKKEGETNGKEKCIAESWILAQCTYISPKSIHQKQIL